MRDTHKPPTRPAQELQPTAQGMERPLTVHPHTARICILDGHPDPWEALVEPDAGPTDPHPHAAVAHHLPPAHRPAVTRAVLHLRLPRRRPQVPIPEGTDKCTKVSGADLDHDFDLERFHFKNYPKFLQDLFGTFSSIECKKP